MIETIEAEDAWWPPTLTPEGLGRTRFARWTMAVDNQSTRSWTSRSTSSWSSAGTPWSIAAVLIDGFFPVSGSIACSQLAPSNALTWPSG